MKQTAIYIPFFLFCVAIFGCSKSNIESSLTFELEHFSHVVLNSSFTVVLHESERSECVVSGFEKTLKHISVEQNDSIISIENNKTAGWLNPKKSKLTVDIYSPYYSLVEATETCFISNDTPITSLEFGLVMASKINEADLNLNCNTFYYWNNSPSGGLLRLSGTTEVAKIWNNAIMKVDASELDVQVALVDNNSKGDVIVSPVQRIEYSLRGTGNILLQSAPLEIIEIENSGEGQLIQE